VKRVIRLLEARTEAFASAPLFDFLRDTSIEPRDRLSFAPCVAHFVMTFADLYALVLREEPAKDRYQEIVNAHTREDENHWRWFLADLDKLGADPRMAFSDALRFVWSGATVQMRLLSYHMCRLGLGADSIRKLVLVHCIEAAGKVTVGEVAAVGKEFAALTGKRLVYFGPHHSDTESQHTLEDAGVHRAIEEIVLDDATARELTSVVDQSFELFTAFTNEMLAFARTGGLIHVARGP
jgi:hypothetical protein